MLIIPKKRLTKPAVDDFSNNVRGKPGKQLPLLYISDGFYWNIYWN